MTISQEELDRDSNILKQINYLKDKMKITSDEESELSRLYHEYYVTNSHIRVYWKLY